MLNINILNHSDLQKTLSCCQNAAATLLIPTSWLFLILTHPTAASPSRSSRTHPKPCWWSLSHVHWRISAMTLLPPGSEPYSNSSHSPTEKKTRLLFWRVFNPCGQRSLRHGSHWEYVWLKSSAEWERRRWRRRRKRKQWGWHLMQKVCMQFVKQPLSSLSLHCSESCSYVRKNVCDGYDVSVDLCFKNMTVRSFLCVFVCVGSWRIWRAYERKWHLTWVKDISSTQWKKRRTRMRNTNALSFSHTTQMLTRVLGLMSSEVDEFRAALFCKRPIHKLWQEVFECCVILMVNLEKSVSLV